VTPRLNLLKTCRSIYAETRLLPFSLNKFEIHPAKLCRFLDSIIETQKDAITTLKIDRSTAFKTVRDEISWMRRYQFEKRDDDESLFASWSCLHRMSEMRGLKCVEIGNQYFVELGEMKEVNPEIVIAKIQDYVGDLSVRVVVDDPPVVVGNDGKPARRRF